MSNIYIIFYMRILYRFPTFFGTIPSSSMARSLLQAFQPDGHAVAVPVQELHHVPAPVDEDAERSGKGSSAQFGADNPAQAVEGLAHVAGAAIKR